MSVDGVAIATIISQYASVVTGIYILSRRKSECYAFSFSRLRIDKGILKRILIIGVPAGIQGMMFSFSNVLITTAMNTFPKTTVSANTIASNIDAITYTAMNSFGGYTPGTYYCTVDYTTGEITMGGII